MSLETNWRPNSTERWRRGPVVPPAEPEALDAIVISDLHLGSDNCRAKPLVQLLERILSGCAGELPPGGAIRARRLIINGDVFDSIDFRRLKKTHWRVLSLIRHLSDKIDVIWIAGNHDGSADIVSHLLGVRVEEQFRLHSGGRSLLVVHGHQWDDFIEDHPILTWLADCIYAALQKLDRTHYVARLAKSRSKTFVRCAQKIRRGATARAREQECVAAICGHTHHAVEREVIEGIEYYNSGCWTERPCTYLAVQEGVVTLESAGEAEEEIAAPVTLSGEKT